MLSSFTQRRAPTLLGRALRGPQRSFAEAVAIPQESNAAATPPTPFTERKTSEKIVPTVPTLQKTVAVNGAHGLYAFFRKKTADDGSANYETINRPEDKAASTSRAWHAGELRQKSFSDLHTLWYVLLREKNLLATEREAYRRLMGTNAPGADYRGTQVRKSMARIKYVTNERRRAYEGAIDLLAEQRAEAQDRKQDEKVLAYQLKVWNEERMRRGRELAAARAGRGDIHRAEVKARSERRKILRKAKHEKRLKREEAVKDERAKIEQEVLGVQS
ncbi:mitochondrial 39-S ribosomal protein L47 (MRP-L47)-domain-containing protein [Pterulicium gracile]|uniref:Large ribosomal subunit protein uL29m n=1 Tax=Pterulicium gracile TaxID=1884261 RepID=A0A5C3QJA6_9AGAR|nr:mitochondrial 39-S ribosomal protein L47 (MRP-L47)-domain-containing protein [Pterula gracilis]